MEDYELAELEKKEKERFEKLSAKQLKMSRKIMLLIFGMIGGIFLILGIIFLLCDVTDNETGINIGVIFAPIGAFYILLGAIIGAVLPKSYNYEKYKKRIEKYGAYNYYDISSVVSLYQAKTEMLEERVTALEDEVRRLKNK